MAMTFGSIGAMSLGIQRSLAKATNRVNTSMQRLASGLRINSAKDDPAGLAIANRMQAQIRGYNQAQRNVADGSSLLQTADGALSSGVNILQRIRELAVQSANDTYTDDDRESFQTEAAQLIAEMDRISGTTEFNGISLLDGSLHDFHLQVGANAGDTITIGLEAMTTATLGDGSNTVSTIDLTTREGASRALDIADKAMNQIDRQRSYTGAMMNRLDFTSSNLANMAENTSAARSRIIDVDFAAEASALSRNRVLQQAGIAMLSQVNQQSSLMLQLLQ